MLKRIIKYILYTIVMLLLMSYIALLLNKIGYAGKQFINPWPSFKFSIIGYIFFGICIGLNYIINESKNEGNWDFDFEKLMFVGIPMFFCAFFDYIFFSINFVAACCPNFIKSILVLSTFREFAGVLLGYNLVTCFYKNDETILFYTGIVAK